MDLGNYYYTGINKTLILCLLQVITIYNAIKLGWKVKKITDRKYELRKHIMEADDIHFVNLIDTIVSLRMV